MTAIVARSAGLPYLLFLVLTTFGSALAAEPANLAGSWSGGGLVRYPSGAKETARCHATFKQRSSSSYGMLARCATAAGSVEQTAALRQVAPNHFAGSFKDSDYGVSGSISITVSGSSLDASLSGNNGSGGEFRLNKS